jgi:hypothetical protein
VVKKFLLFIIRTIAALIEYRFERFRKSSGSMVLPTSQPKHIRNSRESTLSIKNFLRQRAVNITVSGSYTLPNWYDPRGKLRTFACRTNRISPFRMIIDVAVVGTVGDRLTSFFPDFGKLDGRISDITASSFLFELEIPKAMRENLANKLTWLEKKQKEPSIPDLRDDARIIPASPHSILTLADGSIQPCFVIDMSVSGAAVSSQMQPEIGTPLAVGACIGRVVRLLPDGFAVKFIERQNRNDLAQLITRFTPPASAKGRDALPHGDASAVYAIGS